MKFVLIYFDDRLRALAEAKLREMGDCFPCFGEAVDEDEVASCDYIVSLGGDGTLLKAAQFAIRHNKRLIGINAGHLGYLCALEGDSLPRLTLDDIEHLHESPRTLLECNGRIAINDVCVLKKNPGRTVTVEAQGIETWKGDGVIVSTATGSTSYNEAAGGYVLPPLSEEIVVTAVCPHFSKHRSVKVKDGKVTLKMNYSTNGCLVIDGVVLGDAVGDIDIIRSDKKLRLMK